MKTVTPLTSQVRGTNSSNANDNTLVGVELQDAIKRLKLLQICSLHGVFSVGGDTVTVKQRSWASL